MDRWVRVHKKRASEKTTALIWTEVLQRDRRWCVRGAGEGRQVFYSKRKGCRALPRCVRHCAFPRSSSSSSKQNEKKNGLTCHRGSSGGRVASRPPRSLSCQCRDVARISGLPVSDDHDIGRVAADRSFEKRHA